MQSDLTQLVLCSRLCFVCSACAAHLQGPIALCSSYLWCAACMQLECLHWLRWVHIAVCTLHLGRLLRPITLFARSCWYPATTQLNLARLLCTTHTLVEHFIRSSNSCADCAHVESFDVPRVVSPHRKCSLLTECSWRTDSFKMMQGRKTIKICFLKCLSSF